MLRLYHLIFYALKDLCETRFHIGPAFTPVLIEASNFRFRKPLEASCPAGFSLCGYQGTTFSRAVSAFIASGFSPCSTWNIALICGIANFFALRYIQSAA